MTVANPGPPPPQSSTSTQAIASLILGILSFFCCPLLAPIAWYIGSQELKAIREGRSPVASEGLAKAGWILGILGTVWMVLIVLWMFLMGGMAVVQGMMNR